MDPATETTVRRQIEVAVPIERAFDVFVERFDEIKPHEHTLLDGPVQSTEFEARVGGRIVDRTADGRECAWARVLAFDPPHRFVISWDITTRWELETDPDRASEVEVRFVADGPDRTRVEVEHRHLDRHGPGWESMGSAVGADDGWPLFLARYADLLT